MTTLQVTHRAIVNKTSVYQKNIFDLSKMKLGTPNAYPHRVLKSSKNEKLGPKVTKGKLSGLPIKTLTLVERESCTTDCEHYLDCYGNSMPFAHRFVANLGLLPYLERDLDYYNLKHKNGFLVRLHVLGDFFSPEYVQFWDDQLARKLLLDIYGYCRWHPNTLIGDSILALRNKYPDRFKIRFSNYLDDDFSARSESIWRNRNDGILCPVQTEKVDSCGACTLCWSSNKPINFLTH